MSTATLPTSLPSVYDFPAISIHLAPAVPMTQDQFFDFCQQNADKRFERTAEGELIIMAPSGGEAGFQDAEVCIQLGIWAKAIGKGKVSGSSGGYILPNSANRAGCVLAFAGAAGGADSGATEEVPAALSLFSH